MPVTLDAAVIEASRVRARLEALVAPDASQWTKTDEVVVGLEPTPLERIPSAYVRTSWERRPRGDVREVKVRALTHAGGLALRLEWRAVRPNRLINDVNVFADACAVVFPADGAEADLETMGTEAAPVDLWYWRAGADEAFAASATGLGTVTRRPEHQVLSAGRWEDGSWRVVLGRPFRSDGVPLDNDSSVPVGFAVWSGAARERAGLKSHSPVWHELRLG